MARSKEALIQLANEETLGNGNLDVVDNLFATDYVVPASGKDYEGPAFVKRFTRQRTDLIDAVLRNDLQRVDDLIKAGVDLDAFDGTMCNPLPQVPT